MNPAGSSSSADFRFACANRKSPSPSFDPLALRVAQCGFRICFLESFFGRVSRDRRRRSHSSGKEPRRLIEQGLPLFVCMRFQDLFHSPSGVLFAFPSRYWFAIGRSRVFSLGGWSPHLQTGFHVSRPTCRKPGSTDALSCTGLSPTAAALSRAFH